MRNAAATFDDEFGYDEPSRKAAPRKQRSAPFKKKKKKKGQGFSLDMHKVARYAAVGMSATLAMGIMVNALMMQKDRHPAPLFGKALPLDAAPPVAVAMTPKAPAPAATQEAASIPVPAPKPRAIVATQAPAEKNGDTDAIAKLLQGSGNATSAEKIDAKTVTSVQRALVKLGFVLKPNGTVGPATKKAIEMFEKDRHLPVKGELTHRLVKIISAESGVKID